LLVSCNLAQGKHCVYPWVNLAVRQLT